MIRNRQTTLKSKIATTQPIEKVIVPRAPEPAEEQVEEVVASYDPEPAEEQV